MSTKINKSEFIRSHSFDVPASDVVDAGKKKGLNLSVEYVHTIRSNARAVEKKAARANRVVSRKQSNHEKTSNSTNSTTDKLLAYAAEIGYAEAIRLIQEARPKAH